MRIIPELLLVAGAISPQPFGEVVLRERLTPKDAVHTVAGTCARHRYSVELRHDDSRNVLSLRADDQQVAPAETVKIAAAIRPGFSVYEPSIAECFWDRPNARVRLLTDGPTSGGTPIWISFEVSPEGQVSAVRED